MRRSRRRGRAALACGLALCLTALVGATPTAAVPQWATLLSAGPPSASPAALAVLAPPTVVAPRLAFTDDSDELAHEDADGCVTEKQWNCEGDGLATGATHTGEASISGNDLVHVSTADDARGEVYLRTRNDDVDIASDLAPAVQLDGPPRRLTCDTATETHPVLSPDRTKVAYASDEGGGWNIWVAWLAAEPQGTDGPGDPLPCADMPRVQATDGPGADLWPTWLGNDALAFSRTVPSPGDQLGDLYAVALGRRAQPVPADAAVRLTDGPAAETQPRAFFVTEGEQDEWYIALTTTQHRTDGSLAVLGPVDPDEPEVLPVTSAWPDGAPVQSTEAVFAVSEGQMYLGFTSTRDDPFGDVFRVRLRTGESDSGEPTLAADPDTMEAISAESGRSESHLALTDAFYDFETEAVYTRRAHRADVSDVHAKDGTGRRVLANQTVEVDQETIPRDESTPAYSPDGTRLAWSRTAETGREIVTARADGTEVRALLLARPPGALDLEPAWSPDGTRIAFVRLLQPEEGPASSQIFVATVAGGTATRVSTEPVDAALWDENPSWSPDGTRLLIARTVVPYPDLAVTVDTPSTAVRGTSFLATVGVTNGGGAARDGATLHVTSSLSITTSDQRCRQILATRLECSYGALPPGATPEVSVSVTADQGGAATISAQIVASEVESDDTNNRADATVVVTESPDVAVDLVLPGSLLIETTSSATVTLSNAPPASSTGPFDVTLVAGSAPSSTGRVEFASGVPAGCSRDTAATAHCTVSGLAPGASTSFVLPIVAASSGLALVSAAVDALPGEQTTSNNQVQRQTSVFTIDIGVAPTGSALSVPVDRSAGRAMLEAGTPAAPSAIRDLDQAPPPSTSSQLWVIGASTGAGAPVVIPADPDCPPTLVCTPTPLEGRAPAWSPDGLFVAYEHRGEVQLAALTDADIDAVADRPETVTNVAAVTGFAANGTPTPSRPVLSHATDPAWSPDGTELAVAGQPAGQPDQSGIYALRPDGTGLRPVAQDRGPESEPAWQPFADVAVTITATPAAGTSGFATVLEATALSSGPASATDITLRVELPPGLTPGAAPPGCTLTGLEFACLVDELAADEERTFGLPATGAAIGAHEVPASVSTPVADRLPDNNVASVVVTVTVSESIADLAVTVATTTPGYVGGTGTTTVTVRNIGPQSTTGATLTLRHPLTLVTVTASRPCLTGIGSCPIVPLAPGKSVTLTARTLFKAAGAGAVTATVTGAPRDPVARNDVATVALTVRQPALRLSPNVATPAGVTVASGTDFPPGALVELAWDVGIMQRMSPVTVAADGTIAHVQIIVFRRDRLGPRNLLATGVVAGQFTPVKVELLVAPRSVAPPSFIERN